MRYLTVILSLICMVFTAACGQGRPARRLCRRQRRLQERLPASQPPDRCQVDGGRASQCRLRRRRRHQPDPRQDDRAAARIRQEGAGRRRRGVLLCRPRHRHQRHQLSAADRCRHQIGDGRQARRRDQYRSHARPDHGRRQGQAGVPRCLPRQSVRRQDQVEFRDPQRFGAVRPCGNEIRRRHPDRVRHRPRTNRARRPGRHQQPVHPRADGQHRHPRRRDPAGDDQGPRPGQRGDQQGPVALGPHQPDRLGLSQSGRSAGGGSSRGRR